MRIISLIFLFFNILILSKTHAVTPHRAFYKISLVSTEPTSEIIGTTGTMILEINKVCSGWTIKQNSSTEINLKNHPTEYLIGQYVAWESFAGDKLSFHTNRSVNNRMIENINGTAEFTETESIIEFTAPEAKKVVLNKDTLSPMRHLKHMIASAQNGKSLVSSNVFDGSFYGNPSEVSTFIGGSRINSCKVKTTDAQAIESWPMYTAVYSSDSEKETPEVEIVQVISSQGIMCSYTIDFKNYKIKGILDKVEILPINSCEQ